MYAARAIFAALKKGDTSGASLAEYDRLVNDSYIVKDMHRTRNMRLAVSRAASGPAASRPD